MTMMNISSPKDGPKSAGGAFADTDEVPIEIFPDGLHGVLKEIRNEGEEHLQVEELHQAFEYYAGFKRAAAEGTIVIKSLPKEIQPMLKVFDEDGNGVVEPMELARAAKLYKLSKMTVRRLWLLSFSLLVLVLAMVGANAGLIYSIVDAAKDTGVDSNDVLVTKGTTKALATRNFVNRTILSDLPDMPLHTIFGMSKVHIITTSFVSSYRVAAIHKTRSNAVTIVTLTNQNVTVTKEHPYAFFLDGVKLDTTTGLEIKAGGRRLDDVNTINTWAEPHNANGVTPNTVIDSNDEPPGNNQQRMAAQGY